MALIKVTPQELLDAAARIDRALPASRELAARLPAATGVAAGRGDVAAAIDGFVAAWRYGLDHLNTDAEHLSSLLREAGRAYAEADRAISGAEP